jgi:hypothetical protein
MNIWILIFVHIPLCLQQFTGQSAYPDILSDTAAIVYILSPLITGEVAAYVQADFATKIDFHPSL